MQIFLGNKPGVPRETVSSKISNININKYNSSSYPGSRPVLRDGLSLAVYGRSR